MAGDSGSSLNEGADEGGGSRVHVQLSQSVGSSAWKNVTTQVVASASYFVKGGVGFDIAGNL